MIQQEKLSASNLLQAKEFSDGEEMKAENSNNSEFSDDDDMDEG
jgi:hypothetical protein